MDAAERAVTRAGNAISDMAYFAARDQQPQQLCREVILPDVNVLVYAFRREAEHHERYAAWLTRLVAGADELALHDTVLTGVARVVINPKIFADPAPLPVALDFLARIRAARRVHWLPPGETAWTELEQLAEQDRGLRANLVPDALLAALARAHNCRVATADRGFARFPGVRSFDPAE